MWLSPLALKKEAGVFGPKALILFSDITRCIQAVTQEVKACAYLFQQISVAIQHGSTAAVLQYAGPAH